MEVNDVWRLSEWIEKRGGRSMRFAAEYLGPQQRFENQNAHDFVVCFGSARIKSSEKTYLDAREISEKITSWAINPLLGARENGTQRFFITSGGGPGIMQAANEGAKLAGGRSIALGIQLPFEQGINEFANPELSIDFRYFAMRKFWFVYPAKVIIAFPGGFGTLDEVFEVLTLIQTKKVGRSLPVILHDKQFWSKVINFDTLLNYGTISESDLSHFVISDSVEQTVSIVIDHLTNLPENENHAP